MNKDDDQTSGESNDLPSQEIKQSHATKKLITKSNKQIFGILSLKKHPLLEKHGTNELLEKYLNLRSNELNLRMGALMETPEELEQLKIESIEKVKQFALDLNIGLPDDLEKNIHVQLYTGSLGLVRGMRLLGNIKINNAVFCILPYERKLALLVHEIAHIVATSLNKVYYDYKYDKDAGRPLVGNFSLGYQTGYNNRLVGGHKGVDIGDGLNEGFTELIAFSLLHKNNIPNPSARDSFNMYYIFIIDGIINALEKKSGISYETLFRYLIKGNLLGDTKYLKIIKEHLGKELFDELCSLGSGGEQVSMESTPSMIQKIDNFILGHTDLYPSGKLSKNMLDLIGDSNYRYFPTYF